MNAVSKTAMPLWKKLLIALFVVLLLLLVSGLLVIRNVGAWNILFPSHAHETVPPEIPDSLVSPAVLLFTKTNGFRHIEGIAAGLEYLEQVAVKRGWSTFHTENGAVFNEGDLNRFDAVVFLNASGDILDQQQQQAFQSWLTRGGGWLGVHAAGDGSHKDWPWYVENLVGVDFIAHPMGPQFQVARVEVENPGQAAMQNLPGEWLHDDEWYSWVESPRGKKDFDVLASIDESSYSPWLKIMGKEKDLRMGDHPVVWSRCVDSGRALYSAMGHSAASYQAPEHRLLLENALAWVIGQAGQACPE